MRISCWLSLFTFLIFSSCSRRANEAELLEKLEKLNEMQARVDIEINGKSFYDSSDVFQSSIVLHPISIEIGLNDNQKGSNIQMQMSQTDWYKKDKPIFNISSMSFQGYQDYGQILIGRQISGTLEGYILSRARLTFEELKEEYAVLIMDGFVVKPQDAIIESNEIPIKGTILFKKPLYRLVDLEKEDIRL